MSADDGGGKERAQLMAERLASEWAAGDKQHRGQLLGGILGGALALALGKSGDDLGRYVRTGRVSGFVLAGGKVDDEAAAVEWVKKGDRGRGGPGSDGAAR